jgi:hypothetical protein
MTAYLSVNPDHPWAKRATEVGDELLAQCATSFERSLVWTALTRGFLEGVQFALDTPEHDLPMGDDDTIEYASPFIRFTPTDPEAVES